MSYSRFAIYYVPTQRSLTDFGTAWLGWDLMRGHLASQYDLPGLHDITMTPRKYGFHGTLKPPFRLKAGATADALAVAVATLASNLPAARCDGLELRGLGQFLALTPQGDTGQIQAVADACVRELDIFRAALTPTELARRRKAELSPRQDALLERWGYPYVLEEYRFHLTLSGPLPTGALDDWRRLAGQTLPDLPNPFILDQIALCGERDDGRFELIHAYALTG